MSLLVLAILPGCTGLVRNTDAIAAVTDTTPPTVRTTSHTNGDWYDTETTITGVASDTRDSEGNPGTIMAVEYSIDTGDTTTSIPVGEDGSFSFTIDTSNKVGTIRIHIKATDQAANTVTRTVTLVPPRHFVSFQLRAEHNATASINQDVAGSIVQSTVTLPVLPSTDATHLIPSFTFKGSFVSVNGTSQTSGVDAQNFASPVEYQVFANDGTSTLYTITVLAGPTAVAPEDRETVETTRPTFQWSAVPHAESYEVQIASAGQNIDNGPVRGTQLTTFQPDWSLDNLTESNWRVRAIGPGLVPSPWSTVRSVSVNWGAVGGLSPESDVLHPYVQPTLTWDPVPEADHYVVEIVNQETDLASEPGLIVDTAQFIPDPPLDRDAVYTWRVTAVDAGGVSGPPSVVHSFEVPPYAIGDAGPAGGTVFYVKEQYSDGWRYLEAAPTDLTSDAYWWKSGMDEFGLTGEEIGTGEANTIQFVEALGDGSYAARLCYEYELSDFNDWFLPSVLELNEMARHQDVIGGLSLNHDHYYLSSTTSSTDYYAARHVWTFNFGLDGGMTTYWLTRANQAEEYQYPVRAVRRF